VSSSPSRRSLTTTLNLVGAAFISYDLATRALRGDPPVIAAFAWAAVAAWVVAGPLPERRVRARARLYVVMIVAGSVTACATDLIGFVPAIAGLLAYIGGLGRPWRDVAVVVAASAALLPVGAVAVGSPVSLLISALSFLLAVVLGGLSRRQFRAAEAQTRALLEERLAVEQERALVAALTDGHASPAICTTCSRTPSAAWSSSSTPWTPCSNPGATPRPASG
jgi:hypothetical protein